jgi:hypothetical protein
VRSELALDAPAALLIVSANHVLLGVLSSADEPAGVSAFVKDPGGEGFLPQPTAIGAPLVLESVREGVPRSWLITGVWVGKSGFASNGLDAEAVIRPNRGEAYLRTRMGNPRPDVWAAADVRPDGSLALAESLTTSYQWSHGTAYAHLYMHSASARRVWMRVAQSGYRISAWLNGERRPSSEEQTSGAQEQETGGSASLFDFSLLAGWNTILLKLNTMQLRGEAFTLKVRFTEEDGAAANALRSSLSDPEQVPGITSRASELQLRSYTDARSNLPIAGDPISLRLVLMPPERRISAAGNLTIYVPFQARLRLELRDYEGQAIASLAATGSFPGELTLPLGQLLAPGFYAVHVELRSAEGKTIRSYEPDGFSVIGDNRAQRARLEGKKVWNNYYYLGDSRFYDKAERPYQLALPWTQRMGLFKHLGSHWSFDEELWRSAEEHEVVLVGDFDDPHQVSGPEDKRALAKQIAPHTRYFKSHNEIDIDRKVRPAPARWTEITRWDYEAAHAARADAVYVGGSLARPLGDSEASWFMETLRLGIDRYLDRWDVHAYPQSPPRLESPIGNSSTEGDRAITEAYRRIGRPNQLPFWLGETSGLPWHGYDGLRWQADTTAKLVAWANSRSDVEAVAFTAAFAYARELPNPWDYALAHLPAEAALYTASALIDGMPYRRISPPDNGIQAAYFGDTLMAWSTGGPKQWATGVCNEREYVLVDVVGRIREPSSGDTCELAISRSPVYLLPLAEYERMTSPAEWEGSGGVWWQRRLAEDPGSAPEPPAAPTGLQIHRE